MPLRWVGQSQVPSCGFSFSRCSFACRAFSRSCRAASSCRRISSSRFRCSSACRFFSRWARFARSSSFFSAAVFRMDQLTSDDAGDAPPSLSSPGAASCSSTSPLPLPGPAPAAVACSTASRTSWTLRSPSSAKAGTFHPSSRRSRHRPRASSRPRARGSWTPAGSREMRWGVRGSSASRGARAVRGFGPPYLAKASSRRTVPRPFPKSIPSGTATPLGPARSPAASQAGGTNRACSRAFIPSVRRWRLSCRGAARLKSRSWHVARTRASIASIIPGSGACRARLRVPFAWGAYRSSGFALRS